RRWSTRSGDGVERCRCPSRRRAAGRSCARVRRPPRPAGVDRSPVPRSWPPAAPLPGAALCLRWWPEIRPRSASRSGIRTPLGCAVPACRLLRAAPVPPLLGQREVQAAQQLSCGHLHATRRSLLEVHCFCGSKTAHHCPFGGVRETGGRPGTSEEEPGNFGVRPRSKASDARGLQESGVRFPADEEVPPLGSAGCWEYFLERGQEELLQLLSPLVQVGLGR